MEDIRNAYKILVWNLKGNDHSGKRNMELCNELYFSRNMEKVIRLKISLWAGCVAHLEDIGNAYKILVWNIKGNYHLGKRNMELCYNTVWRFFTGFSCLRLGSVGEILLTGWWITREFFWPSECCMEKFIAPRYVSKYFLPNGKINVNGELRKCVDVTLPYVGRCQQSFGRPEETEQKSQSLLANHRALNGSGTSQS